MPVHVLLSFVASSNKCLTSFKSNSFLLLLVRHLLLLAWHLFLVAWHLLLLVRLDVQDPRT